jgi:hypothetical protein
VYEVPAVIDNALSVALPLPEVCPVTDVRYPPAPPPPLSIFPPLPPPAITRYSTDGGANTVVPKPPKEGFNQEPRFVFTLLRRPKADIYLSGYPVYISED